MLVRHWANAAAKRPDGFFILVYAAFENDSLLVEQLMRNQDSTKPLIDALEQAVIAARDEDWTNVGHKLPFAILHDLEVVAWMILEYSKVDANAPMPPEDFNMLVTAAHVVHHGIVKLLLRRGADVNGCLQANISFKAVHTAAERGDLEMVKTLIEYGCDIYDVDGGRGRLGIAVMIGPKQIVYVTSGDQ